MKVSSLRPITDRFREQCVYEVSLRLCLHVCTCAYALVYTHTVVFSTEIHNQTHTHPCTQPDVSRVALQICENVQSVGTHSLNHTHIHTSMHKPLKSRTTLTLDIRLKVLRLRFSPCSSCTIPASQRRALPGQNDRVVSESCRLGV
jgi:hypothetical protein